jgi:N-ethylmaleimide reductase
VAQLLHGGRIGHKALTGFATVAPSSIKPEGKTHLPTGMVEYDSPDELTIPQIKAVVDDFVVAGQNALLAGFDAVEIHGANGYLPNQFLSENTNQRTDEYGGSVQNRSRFVLEVVQALTQALGPNKVGIRLSPSGTNNGAAVLDPFETYNYLISELNKEDLAYLHLMEAFRVESLPPHFPKEVAAIFRPLFNGPFIASGGMTADKAEEMIQSGLADLVAFGSAFIANPDLVARMKADAPLASSDRATYYSGGAKGYIDYPAYAE